MNPSSNSAKFRVVITGDFYYPDGSLRYPDIGLNLLERANHMEVTRFNEHRNEIGSDQIGSANGVIVLAPRVTRASLQSPRDLLALGRFGVGYDTVDVAACTEANVVLYITPGAVNRSVAEATVCWMLALSHHVRAKDTLVRAGRWDERTRYLGCELRNRTLGIVGFGRIGQALVELLRGLGMNPPLAFDPYVKPEAARTLGVKLVSLDELLAQSDFVSIHCLLNDETRNLIGARELGLMKRTAYLLNTARGGIVNEDALFEALKSRRIAGAGIDCFVGEPITKPHRFGELDNVLLAPHAICWTEELFSDIGRMCCQGMLDLSLGKTPNGVVNPEVLEKPDFQEKWRRVTGAFNR
ncbi:MAG: hydroxyacid dehydrogenase [Verrucomicrobia bacterium]|nr:hydroxyacid dehydrogenase [Verrucomicrobiota bacterium]